MKQKQDMLAIREATGKRLRELRRGRKWDDVINELIDCFLQHVRCVSIEHSEIGTGRCRVRGLSALEIRRGDIVNLYTIRSNDDEIKEQYVMVTNMKQVAMEDEQATAIMEYKEVEL